MIVIYQHSLRDSSITHGHIRSPLPRPRILEFRLTDRCVLFSETMGITQTKTSFPNLHNRHEGGVKGQSYSIFHSMIVWVVP
jgi:hypothetical protein